MSPNKSVPVFLFTGLFLSLIGTFVDPAITDYLQTITNCAKQISDSWLQIDTLFRLPITGTNCGKTNENLLIIGSSISSITSDRETDRHR